MKIILVKWDQVFNSGKYTLFVSSVEDAPPTHYFEIIDAVGDPFAVSYKLLDPDMFSLLIEGEGIECQENIAELYEECGIKARRFKGSDLEKIYKQLYGKEIKHGKSRKTEKEKKVR